MRTMENRIGVRKPVYIETTVEAGRREKRIGRIRDVSLGGLFLELPPEGMASNTLIKLHFSSRNGRICHWQGVVVRVAERGVGASFLSADPRDQQGLMSLLEAD